MQTCVRNLFLLFSALSFFTENNCYDFNTDYPILWEAILELYEEECDHLKVLKAPQDLDFHLQTTLKKWQYSLSCCSEYQTASLYIV